MQCTIISSAEMGEWLLGIVDIPIMHKWYRLYITLFDSEHKRLCEVNSEFLFSL